MPATMHLPDSALESAAYHEAGHYAAAHAVAAREALRDGTRS